MKITKPENLDEFNKFIDNLSSKDNIALMHDTDADGLSAATIVTKALEKENISIKKFLIQDHSSNRTITDEFIQKLDDEKINKLICVDLALEDFNNISKIKIPTLIIDHHIVNSKNIPKNITVYKPFMVQEELYDSEVCAANLTYQLFSQRNNLEEIDWIVSIGIIGDYTFKQEKTFLDKVFKKYFVKEKENIYDTSIGIVVQYLTFANCIQTEEAIKRALKAMIKSSNIKEATQNLKEFEVVDKEIKKAYNNFDKEKKQLTEDLFIYIYKSPYKINSPVSSMISVRNIHHTYITMQEFDDIYKISARRQDKEKDMSYLLRNSTKDLENANGGGHIPAAGGKIKKEDLDKFMNKLKLTYLNMK